MSIMAAEDAGTAARARRARPASRSSRPIRADVTDAPSRPSRAAQSFRQAAPTSKISRGNYQGIILAEFVAAIVLTAATPIASRNKGGLSPYVASDMVQLAALTMIYFILALISTGGGFPSKLAAYFGGLILLGVGLTEASSIAKTLDVFGTGAPPPGTTPAKNTTGGQIASGGLQTG